MYHCHGTERSISHTVFWSLQHYYHAHHYYCFYQNFHFSKCYTIHSTVKCITDLRLLQTFHMSCIHSPCLFIKSVTGSYPSKISDAMCDHPSSCFKNNLSCRPTDSIASMVSYYTKFFTSASRSGNFAIFLQVYLVHICVLMPLFYVKIWLKH